MRFAGRTLAVATAGCLAAAGGAWGARVRAGATYRATIGKRRAALVVSRDTRTMRFAGAAIIGLACPPYGLPPGPPVAVVLISSSSRLQRTQGASPPPLVRIHTDGTFSGTRKGLRFRGRFTGRDGLSLRIAIKDPGCFPRRARYRFRLTG